MDRTTAPAAVPAAQIPPRTQVSKYPEPFAARMQGREKRALGDWFGLTRFGINLTCLRPGASSALRHAHAGQDEFIYILEGRPTLHTDAGHMELAAGMCAGFRAGTGNAHRLINQSAADVLYLELGDRSSHDVVIYPDDDLKAVLLDGVWVFQHKDGTCYP